MSSTMNVHACVCVCLRVYGTCTQSFLEVYKTARSNRLPYEDLHTLGDAIRVLFRAAEDARREAKEEGRDVEEQCEAYDDIMGVLSALDSVFNV